MTRAKDISKIVTDANLSGTLDVTGETTLTTHLNMGDGDIIKLGAGSDLQIFHDGSNSRIQETGTGNLFIDADASVNFRGNSGSENMAKFNANGAVQLYYDDAEKLATTSTGIDVTGAVTAGGLTVNGSSADLAVLNYTDDGAGQGPNLFLRRTSASPADNDVLGSVIYQGKDSGGNTTSMAEIKAIATDVTDGSEIASLNLRTRNGSSGQLDRLKIDGNGDISFYEDTGTTPKFFWDASTERLGIGTASPVRAIHVESSDTLVGRFKSTGSTEGFIQLAGSGTSTAPRLGATGNHLLAYTSDTERMRIDSSGNVGIGLSSNIDRKLHVEVDNTYAAKFGGTGGGDFAIEIGQTGTNQSGGFNSTNETMKFSTEGSEKMRLDNGHLLVGTTSTAGTSVGSIFLTGTTGRAGITSNGDDCMRFNRLSSDGILVRLMQASSTEGNISVSGSLVSYNGGHLSRWSQLADNTRDNTLVKGTVMTNLDQMAEWTTDGITEDNEQLNCMAVSSVEGDANVAGVFINWDDDDDIYTNDMNIAMTGDVVIRIAQGTTVARGDLLMSAGDGTAKPQGDDIVRSKTIAKVTSTNVSHTYDDGTYLVPCVLMAC